MSNTKGTSPIVPPQGGGAQSGLGEKFSPDLFTGTGNFSVPVAVPPGRNGFQPELTLGYSTGNGNGTFGMGWALGIPGVTRKTSRGIPVYDDRQDIFILSGAEDLVPVASTNSATVTSSGNKITHQKTQYRPRTEGLFARIIHHKKTNGENYWEVRSKDGLISFYGTPDSEGNDPCVIANPENRKAIFAWCLSKTVDPYGNEIVYEYERDFGSAQSPSNPHKYDQLYLTSIKYAQYMDGQQKKYLCEVKFNYEEREDAFSVYRQGFEMRTTRRCVNIETYTHADETRKTKTYHFNYLSGDKLPLNGASMLKSVSVEGHPSTEEMESEWMPPLEFGYSKYNPSRRGLRRIEGPIPAMMLSQPGFELVDLNGNGLPDLLQLDGIAARYWTNKGSGTFSNPRNLGISPTIQLGQPGVQLIDANGNGRSDLLVTNGVQAGYFSGSFNGVWDEKNYRPYSKAPSFTFADPEVQLMDLDGDGMTDVLRNGAKFECFFNDPQKGFDKIRVTDKTFADFSFADPRIRFADMTGDGLQDIVLISSGRVQYWPNLGYGRFGKKRNMKNAPRFPEQYNPAQVLLGDLDGDGLADIAFVENNSVTLYVNQSANGFSQGTKVMNTPAVFNPNDLRIVDILGTGQPGVLWSMAATDGRHGKMYFLDFTNNNKPYVLEEMNNNMGSITRVEYGSSIYHYLRDEKNPITRWKTELPFPVQVVNRVEVLDLLSGGKLATEYNYHNGYWDGAEREFRGFAQVDTVDTETFERFTSTALSNLFNGSIDNNLNSPDHLTSEQYTPPVLTKSWFYPGPVGEDFTRWHEVDFSEQYWQGDANVLERTNQMKNLLASLPRRARRDALRTLRGTLLRSETYGLDGTPLQSKPYTVSESLMSVRKEFDPAQDPALFTGWERSGQGFWAGTGFIFFPFSVAQRTTQYERGNDPMHSMSFVKDYDAYGHPLGELSLGLPRGSSPQSGGQGNYLATYGESEFIYTDLPDGQYMVDRVKRSVSYDATRSAQNTSVFTFKDSIFNANLPDEDIIGCTLNFYDGAAFIGLPYGEIGEFGAVVRSETLVITDGIIAEAYESNTPECFKGTPDWSDINGYPAAFAGLLQNGDVRLGYKDRRNSFPNHIEGWYAEGGRMKYDWQQFDPLTDPPPVGLVLETKDVFENRSTIEYDDYQLLPLNAKQWFNGTDYLETTAEYDYRVMQAYKITDPNDNITEFDFSPLGLLTATAVIGKGTEGDYKAATGSFYERFAPSVRMEYDFFAFKNEGNPVWVKTIQREQHWQDDPDPDSPTIVSKEYSDGFGRLLQTRAQAEDVIFGNQTFGSSGLNANQSSTNTPAVGTEREENDPLNVVVSGWQIYNNKGEVVEQYEPFFDKGFEYTLPQLSSTGGIIPPQLGVKIKMYYDPLGRVVKTVNPDNSEQRVIYGIPNALNTPNSFTPTSWENYAYDANDLAPLTNPSNSNVPESHWYTPKSSLVDALGRTIQTTEHKAHYNGEDYENVVMKYAYDIRGSLLEIRDPYNRKVFEHVYDLRPAQEDENGEKPPLPPLWTRHIDSGKSRILFDATGKPIESSDAKDARSLSTYDTFSRPTNGWSQNNYTDTLRLIAHAIYGEEATDPKDRNLLGQLWQQYDESGKIESEELDFKGNLLSKKQWVISSAELKSALDNYQTYLVDWTGLPSVLGTQEFETSSEFDALNRPTKITLPENVNTDRKEIVPTYNRAGGLEKVHYDGTEYVNNIVYNAKGQRLLIAFGNDVMTRYVYSNSTFRLLRQKSEKFTYAVDGNTHTYTPTAGTKRQDDGYIYDLIGNIFNINIHTTACGVGGTDVLTRVFQYDPLYRLTSGTGRENVSGGSYPFPGWDDTTRSSDTNTTVAYTRQYNYDKLGNVQQVKQLGTNGFTRDFNYISNKNKLESVEISTNSYNYTYDNCGNQLTENTTRNFEWDAANRLILYKNQTGSSEPSVIAQYLYDSAGNRVKKIVRKQGGDYEIRTYIDGIFEHYTDETDEQNTIHIMDDQSRVATLRIGDDMGDSTPAIKYELENNIYSSTVVLDDVGAVVNTQEYYPFGETSFGSYGKKRYQYVGKERDEESGLYYYGARYYSPWIARFISCDPLSAKYAQLSPYNYADNNPINDFDIDGMQNNNSEGSAESTPSEHIIVEGDTFWSLENKYNLVHGTLIKLNPGVDYKNLQKGQKINLSKPNESVDGKKNIKIEAQREKLKLENMRVVPSDRLTKENYQTKSLTNPQSKSDSNSKMKERERLPFGESTEEKKKEWYEYLMDPVFGGWEHGGPTVGPSGNGDGGNPSIEPDAQKQPGVWEYSQRAFSLEYQFPKNSLDNHGGFRVRTIITQDTIWYGGILNPETDQIEWNGERRYLINVIEELYKGQ